MNHFSLIKLSALMLNLVIFSTQAEARSTYRDDGTQTYQLLHSWKLKVKTVESKDSSATFKDIRASDHDWVMIRLVRESGGIEELAITDNGRITAYAKKFTLTSDSPLIGFTDRHPDTSIINLEGKQNTDLSNSISVISGTVFAVPKAGLLNVLGHAAFLRQGTISPEQFLARAAKVPEMKPYADLILKSSLFGDPKEIVIPFNLRINSENKSAQVTAYWRLSASEEGAKAGAKFSRIDELKIRTELKTSICSGSGNTVDSARFCRFLNGHLFENQISQFIFGGMRALSTEQLASFGDSLDHRGRNLLMRIIPMGCGREDVIGASGFKSGDMPMSEVKAKLMESVANRIGNLEERDLEGLTALNHSIYLGCTKESDWLISKGASLSTRDNKGRSMLIYAIQGGNPRYIDLALKNVTPEELEVNGYVEIADTYSGYGGGRGVRPWRHTPIGLAIGKADYPTVKKILGLKPKMSQDSIIRIYNYAFNRKNAQLVKVMTDSGLDIGPFLSWSPDRFADIRKHATPEEKKKSKDFFQLIDQLEKKNAKK